MPGASLQAEPACAPAHPGGVFYSAAVHDVDIASTLLGERAPDTVFALGSALCQGKAGFLSGASCRHLSGTRPGLGLCGALPGLPPCFPGLMSVALVPG